MRCEPKKVQALLVGAFIRASHDELHINAPARQGMARLDRLDPVGTLHRKPDVGKVEKLHSGASLSVTIS